MGNSCKGAGRGPVQDAWDNHFSAFGTKDVDKILLDYTAQSVITIYDQNTGTKTVHSGLEGARACFEGLFNSLSDTSDLDAPVQVVKEAQKREPGSVFLVWKCPASGYVEATDTFIFDKSSKILRQNVVVNFKDPKSDGSVVAKNDAEAPTGSGKVHRGWANHFKAFGDQDVEAILKDYVAESEITVFNHADGTMNTFSGLEGARSCFEGLFKTLHNCSDLAAPIIHVDESEKWSSLKTFGQVFLVWNCPASSYQRATDTFIFNNKGKIIRQNVVVHYVPAPLQDSAKDCGWRECDKDKGWAGKDLDKGWGSGSVDKGWPSRCRRFECQAADNTEAESGTTEPTKSVWARVETAAPAAVVRTMPQRSCC
jgi:hypothetical protein